MINSVVLVGLISDEIFFDKNENKNNEIKFVSFNLFLEKKFVFQNKNNEKYKIFIKTYDFFFKNFKKRSYQNTFVALKGRIQIEKEKIFIFADKISLLGKKS